MYSDAKGQLTEQKQPAALFDRRSLPWLIVAALAAFLAFYVRLRLLNVPLERDEGEFAYFAQLMLDGIPPYLDAYTLKFPGAALMYALFMVVFGESASGIHLGLLFSNAAACLLLFLVCRRLFDSRVALAGAAVYAVMSVSMGVYGVFAHATHFVVLFALAGFLLLMRALEEGRGALLLASGFLFGVAILMKQHGVFFALFAWLYLAATSLRGGTPAAGGKPQALRALSLFTLGGIAPFALCCLALFLAGTFDQFWFWTFEYAREYVSSESLAKGVANFRRNFGLILQTTLPLWLLAACGLVFLFTDKEARRGRTFVLGFLLFSFLATCPGLYFRRHYFVMLLPACALLAGLAAVGAGNLLERRNIGRRSGVAAALLLLAAVSCYAYLERPFFFSLDTATLARAVYGDNPFPESVAVGRYLKENSSPGDRIAVLGSEPQINFYADRRSATGHIYMYGLMEEQKYAARMQQELVREVESASPAYVVFVNVRASWLMRPGSHPLVFNWAPGYLQRHYDMVGVVDIMPDRTEYVWGGDATSYRPRSRNFLTVFKRRG